MTLKIQNLQDSHLSEFQFTRDSQRDILNQMIAQLHNVQEVQGRMFENLYMLSYGQTDTRENPLQGLENRGGPEPDTQQRVTSKSGVLTRQDQGSAYIGLTVQQCEVTTSRQSCLCRCHWRRKWQSYQVLDKIVGTLFLGYSSAPNLTQGCDLPSCSRNQRSLSSVLYIFPSWFLQRAISIVLLYTHRDGPSMSLRTLRLRRLADPVFHFATVGEVTQIKALFDRGEASPFDIGTAPQVCLLSVGFTLIGTPL